MNMIITIAKLQQLDACPSQIIRFKELFGTEVKVTEELCVQYAQEFDFSWAAKNFLPITAQEVYWEDIVSSQKVYNETTAMAWKACSENWETQKVYNKEVGKDWDAFRGAVASASKIYQEAKARAFARVSKV